MQKHFDLRPKGIVQMLDLLRPIYEKTAAYGHFGRDEPEFTWEKTDKAQALAAEAGMKKGTPVDGVIDRRARCTTERLRAAQPCTADRGSGSRRSRTTTALATATGRRFR